MADYFPYPYDPDVGCWTAYVLRDEDGSCWVSCQKYGERLLTNAHDRSAIVEAIRRSWHVGYAWGRIEDFPELVPAAKPAMVMELGPDSRKPLEDLRLMSREHWFADWDPMEQCISVLHDSESADWCGWGGSVISIITTSHLVLDYRIDHSYGLLDFLTYGESFLAALLAQPPYPMASERDVSGGAVIDLPGRQLRYWTTDPMPSRLVKRLTAAWPGWQVERLSFGLAGQLAATGRRDEELLILDIELSRSGYVDDWWLAERRTLPIDPRGLRPARVRVVEGRS